jgi:hypothetical protein
VAHTTAHAAHVLDAHASGAQMVQATTFSFFYLQRCTIRGMVSIERCEFIHYFLLAFAVITPILAVCTWELPPSTTRRRSLIINLFIYYYFYYDNFV